MQVVQVTVTSTLDPLKLWGFFSQKSSECGSAVSTKSSLSDDEDMGWSFSWPPTVWHCFLKGRSTHGRTHTYTRTRCRSSAELSFSACRDSPALPLWAERGVARRGGPGLCRRGRGWGGAIHVSEGTTPHGQTGLVIKGPAVSETQFDLLFFFCRLSAQKACSWWSTLRSSCPGRLSCSWPSTPACLDTPPWPRAASWITPSTSKTKVLLLRGAKRCAGVPMWRTRLHSVCFPSRLDLLLSQPDCGASWDTVPRTGSGGAVPPSGTQRCQTRRQLVGLRENQEVNETTADVQWAWSEDEAWNIHGFILSSSAMTSLLWTTPPSTCWVAWPGGGGPPSPAAAPFPQTDACRKVLNFKTANFVHISKNRTDKLRILFYFVSILFSIQSNEIVSICSI